jgi:hypothetical protein
MTYIVASVIMHDYNPGLFSAIVIFLPSFFWLCKACFGDGGFRNVGIGVLLATGIILHIIPITSVLLFAKQKIGSGLLDFIQIINASTIVLLPWLVSRFLKIYSRKREMKLNK